MRSKLFFCWLLLASLFCGTSALLAEDGTEECCPIPIETCLEQARGVVELGENFLQGLQDGIVEVKEAEELISGLIKETFLKYPVLAENKDEYDEAIFNFFGRNSRSKLKND